jgi:hypothetical protein
MGKIRERNRLLVNISGPVYTAGCIGEGRKEYLSLKLCISEENDVKVKLSLCLTKHHAMKAYWEWRYSSIHSLTFALDGS